MDAVEDIKQRLAIEDVIGEYVELKRAGRSLKGLSPFTSEKTPSFMVSPEKQIWHDFSSGKGGNMFSFVMEMEGLDFKATLELLAQKAGVDLSQYRGKQYGYNAKLKERLYQLLDVSTRFYQLELKKNRPALEYLLKDRAFDKDTILEFRIGYSPGSGSALARHIQQKGFTEEEFKKAGLGRLYGGNLRDMFRNRVMIPLMDPFGRVIGFTARLLHANPSAPKYINTPATILYDKGRHVFGLHMAKEPIRRAGFAVVVEGNMDVIASHQAGVANVVATAGTAMTSQHLKEISRFATDIRLSFDQDQAGMNATERTAVLAAQMDLNLGVITIAGGKDPDELVRTDKDAWQKAIQNSEYFLDWLLAYYAKGLDLKSAAGKKAFAAKASLVLGRVANAVEQDHYKTKIADMLGVSLEAINKQSQPTKPAPRLKKPKTAPKINKHQADILRTENQYMALMLLQPSLRVYMDVVKPSMLYGQDAKDLYTVIKQHSQEKGPDILGQTQDVQSIVDYGKIVTLLYEELYAHLEFIELRNEAARLQVRVIENFVKEQKAKITASLQANNDQAAVTELLQKAKKLDNLLKAAKETLRGK